MLTAIESTVRETDGRNFAYKTVGCECFVTDFLVLKMLFCKSQKQEVVRTGASARHAKETAVIVFFNARLRCRVFSAC